MGRRISTVPPPTILSAPLAIATDDPTAPCRLPSRPEEVGREVVERLQRGDRAALAQVFMVYGDRIFNTCRRITGSHADAEDATQEVFLRILHKSSSFTGQSRFSTWLFRVAVNHTINLCRKAASRRHRAIVDLDQEATPQELYPGPLQRAVDLEERQLLDEALQLLPPDQRSIVVLRELEGLTYAEIAEILDLPAGTVTSRLVRGRQRLLQILGRRLPHNEVSRSDG